MEQLLPRYPKSLLSHLNLLSDVPGAIWCLSAVLGVSEPCALPHYRGRAGVGAGVVCTPFSSTLETL